MMKNKLKFGLGFLIGLLIILPLVSAFAVTTPFWDTNPLVLHPGDTTEFALKLQNMLGGKDVLLKASIEEGAEIATLIDENLEYLIPLGSKGIPVNIRIMIPEDVSPSDTKVGVSFRQIGGQEGKMIQMAGGVKTYVPIIIKPLEVEEAAKEEEPSSAPIIAAGILLLVLILAIIIGLVMKKRTR